MLIECCRGIIVFYVIFRNGYAQRLDGEVPHNMDRLSRCRGCVCFLLIFGSETLLIVQVLSTVCVNGAESKIPVFLERGHAGTVPCPLIASGRYRANETEAVYWYFAEKTSSSLLISYFRHRVAPQNGIPDGVYDIDKQFSLVILNATDAHEGDFFFNYKPTLRMFEDGHVPVKIKVSSRGLVPRVSECTGSSESDECKIEISKTSHNLSCQVPSVKPPVEVKWYRILDNGDKESICFDSVVTPEGYPALTNKTYTTTSTISLSSTYRCETYGVALGDRNGSHVTVVVRYQGPNETVALSKMPDTGSVVAPASPDTSSPLITFTLGVFLSISLIINLVFSFYVATKKQLADRETAGCHYDGTSTNLMVDSYETHDCTENHAKVASDLGKYWTDFANEMNKTNGFRRAEQLSKSDTILLSRAQGDDMKQLVKQLTSLKNNNEA